MQIARKGRTRTLSVACIQFDRVRPLFDGRVGVAGYELTQTGAYTMDHQRRLLDRAKCSLVEVGVGFFSEYLDAGHTDYIGLPIPIVRSFRHETFYVAANGRIKSAEQLNGARIGVPDMAGSSAIWQKAILATRYGVDLRGVRWVVGRIDEVSPSWQPPSQRIMAEFDVEIAPSDETLTRRLLDGSLDAILAYRRPEAFKLNNGVVRLFPDYIKSDVNYYRETGIFPVLHLMALNRTEIERDPMLVQKLVGAFTAAKNIAIEEAKESLYPFATVPFLDRAVELAESVFGADFWPYGYEGCRAAINAFIGYCRDQCIVGPGFSADTLLPRQVMPVQVV